MSRIGRYRISSDDSTTPAALAPTGVLAVDQGGTGLDLSTSTGSLGILSGAVKVHANDAIWVDDYYDDADLDDTASITRAIAAAAGRRIILGEKTYTVDCNTLAATGYTNVNCAFFMTGDMHLEGQGVDKTIIKVADGCSSNASPQQYCMFYSNADLSNIVFKGITFDGNGANNEHNLNAYTQAFVAFCDAHGSDVEIAYCKFQNNPGQHNIRCHRYSTAAAGTIGSRWHIHHTEHVDNGMYSTDFTAIFGYAEEMRVHDNIFRQTTLPTDSTGVGAVTAFEVHGAHTSFTHNFITGYFQGVIVNSNWTNPVTDVDIADNLMWDVFLCGVRFWRGHYAIDQTHISHVRIHDNIIKLSDDLYGAATTYKAGFYWAVPVELPVDDVTITNNLVYASSSIANVSAGLYLVGEDYDDNTHERLTFANNTIVGLYRGVYAGLSATGSKTKLGTFAIRGNYITGLLPVGANVLTGGIFVAGGGNSIAHLIIERNTIEGDATDSTVVHYGMLLQDTITALTMSENIVTNVTVGYDENSTTITHRYGDDWRVEYPTASGLTVNNWWHPTRRTYKVSLTHAAWTDADTQQAIVLLVHPAKSRVTSIICDTTTPYTGGGNTAVTLRIGTGTNGEHYILSHDALAGAVTKGLADGDLGTSIDRAHAIQGGYLPSWSTAGSIVITMNTTDGTCAGLTAGATTVYVTLEILP